MWPFHLFASLKYCYPELVFVFLLINLKLNALPIPRVGSVKSIHYDPGEARLEIHRPHQTSEGPGRGMKQ